MEYLNEGNFKVKAYAGTTLIDFSADWCGPCKMMEPILNELVKEQSDVPIYKVDVDTNQDLAMEYGVRSIPTMILLRNGIEVKRLVGSQTKQNIQQLINGITDSE